MNLAAALRALAVTSMLAMMAGVSACESTGSGEGDEALEQEEGGDELGGQIAVGSKLETTATVNLRSGPSTQNKVLKVLPKGTVVVATKSTPSTGFYQVNAGGTVGWVSGKYVAIVEEADNPTPGGSGGGSSAAAVCKGVNTSSFQAPTSCNGPNSVTTKQQPSNGLYASSWFGCYKETNGKVHQDPSDNCIFTCSASKYCDQQGPACQASLRWFSADIDRFGCGAKIRVTNCANGKSVVLVALDRGPSCKSLEKPKGLPVLDMSHDAMTYLFDGVLHGSGDRAGVIVEVVDAATPLGPVD